MGRILSPSLASNTKLSPYTKGPSPFSGERPAGKNPVTKPTLEVRSIVQRRVMSMMEAHDRVRERVLGSGQADSYPVSGD